MSRAAKRLRGGDATHAFGQLLIDDCPICLSALGDMSLSYGGAVRTSCGHLYHKDCLNKHLEVSSACPLCHKHVDRGSQLPVEASSDGELVIASPARDGVLARLMRTAAGLGWNKKKPSPPVEVDGKKYVLWYSFLDKVPTGALNIQQERFFKSSSADESQRGKLGVTLRFRGDVCAPEPGGLYTLAGLMLDNKGLRNPFEEGADWTTLAGWTCALADWEAVMTKAFQQLVLDAKEAKDHVIAPDSDHLGWGGTGVGAPFVPHTRQIAGPGGVMARYLGRAVPIEEGHGYYRDFDGRIMVGWHGTIDPPLSMAGVPLIDVNGAAAPLTAPKISLPEHSVNTILEYLRLRQLLEIVRIGRGVIEDLSKAGAIQVIEVVEGQPSSRSPHIISVLPKNVPYMIWLSETSEGTCLTLQVGSDWSKCAKGHGKFGIVLDNRNMQIRYVVVNGKVVPDIAMPKDGALLRGDWKVPAPGGSGVAFMANVCCKLLQGLDRCK